MLAWIGARLGREPEDGNGEGLELRNRTEQPRQRARGVEQFGLFRRVQSLHHQETRLLRGSVDLDRIAEDVAGVIVWVLAVVGDREQVETQPQVSFVIPRKI